MAGKRFVPISESVIMIAAKVAERFGMPTRDFIEFILAEVLKSLQYRSDVLEVISISDMLDDLRKAGGLVMPQRVVYSIVQSLNNELLTELEDELRKVASWYGTLVRVKRGQTIEALRTMLSVWFPDMNINIVKKDDGSITVVATSSRQPKEVTRLAGAAMSELCKALGLRVESVIIERGVIRLEAKGYIRGEEVGQE